MVILLAFSCHFLFLIQWEGARANDCFGFMAASNERSISSKLRVVNANPPLNASLFRPRFQVTVRA